MKIIISVLLVFVVLLMPAKADLSVHFLDVGQGDAALVICDGNAMLIDGGPSSASQYVYSYLREHTTELTYMVATHPHDDHVSGLAAALNAVPVDVILSPVETWEGSAFDNVERYAKAQGTSIIVPYEGEQFDLGNAVITILHCWPDAWSENDMSIVLRVDYKEVSFVFTGDAESMSEYMMIDSGLPLKADVLKVSHHGSRYSSTEEFIDAVSPHYAVISCGDDNPYGHPHDETIQRLEGVEVLRTDQLGTIVFQTDGISLSVVTNESSSSANQAMTAEYIGNCHSMKFHYPDCEAVQHISPKNRVPLSNREDAIALGYEPCGKCRP